MNYQRLLKKQVTDFLKSMGYVKRGPEDYLLLSTGDIKHMAYVLISRAGGRPMTEVQFAVSSHDLMGCHGFAALASQSEFFPYVRWTLDHLLGLADNVDVEHPADVESYGRLTMVLPDAMRLGHDLSMKIKSVADIFQQMSADRSTCTVSARMEEYLRGRWQGTIGPQSFDEWNSRSDA